MPWLPGKAGLSSDQISPPEWSRRLEWVWMA